MSRHAIATAYLQQLDEAVTNGALQKLCGSHLQIVFSETANDGDEKASTWAKRIGPDDGRIKKLKMFKDKAVVPIDPPQKGTAYHCRFEISDLWVKNADYLKHVLAHEYAHACDVYFNHKGDSSFVNEPGLDDISRMHGRSFKKWAHLISSKKAFGLSAIWTQSWDSTHDEDRFV